ncbi:MAG: FG-GAP-like repeat-containing protein [Pseudomonadota bacterium]
MEKRWQTRKVELALPASMLSRRPCKALWLAAMALGMCLHAGYLRADPLSSFIGSNGSGALPQSTNSELDTDGDGIVDTSDAFPFDASESLDTDNDGIGNNADNDDDNDGLSDSEELGLVFYAMVEAGRDFYGNSTTLDQRLPAATFSASTLIDFDEDGDLDVIAASDQELVWLENPGFASWAPGSGWPIVRQSMPNGVKDIAAVDLDGDDREDIVLTVDSSPGVQWIRNEGGGGFSDPIPVDSMAAPASGILTFDFDQDDDPDLIVSAATSLSTIENLGGGTFGPSVVAFSSDEQIEQVLLNDLDADGLSEIILRQSGGQVTALNLSQGQLVQEKPLFAWAGGALTDLAPVDVDRDGDLDIVAGNLIPSQIVWFENTSDLVFTAGQKLTDWDGYPELQAVDIDQDGDLDILVKTSFARVGVAWLENVPSGWKEPYYLIDYPNIETGVREHWQFEDLTGDGYPDLVGAFSLHSYSGNTHAVGYFQVSSNPQSIDTDSDGVPDGEDSAPQRGTPDDVDGDLMNDDWERSYGLNPADPFDAARDPDGDGQSNLQEYLAGSNPLNSPGDLDGDRMNDEWEISYGLDPTDPSDAWIDTDGDGQRNIREYQNGTDPTRSLVTRLQNLAVRGFVGTGDDVLIGGLVITGSMPKTVVIRARGPALAEAGLADVLADPELALFQGAAILDSNNDWATHPGVDLIPADLKPADYPSEAIIATTLPPGAYTAIVSGHNESTGIGLVEMFEVNDTGYTRLQNISARAFTGAGDRVAIGGLVISGPTAKKVVIRAKGPSLVEAGVQDSLFNPMLTIFSGSKAIMQNDNWDSNANAGKACIPLDLQPDNWLESAVFLNLQPGAYTAIMEGADGGSGIGIVEVFEVLEEVSTSSIDCDTDTDSDGVPDAVDDFPFDGAEMIDTDQDGIGNNADTDDDNDGVLDVNDALPYDAKESVDTDSDGVGDAADAFPTDRAESKDTDRDGIGNVADLDDDNDGVPDTQDTFPFDATESVDTDGDGLGDNADTDDDNDGVLDVNDDFPLDATESVDTDGDGIGNNADTDDDGDGIPDAEEVAPLEKMDTDGDGIGDNLDTDDDNDGILDSEDIAPLDSAVPWSTSRLFSMSTRGYVGSGDNVMIGRFTINGTEPKPVILRALGTDLALHGVWGALADPELALFSGATLLDSNDNWESHPGANLIPENLKPSHSVEAAIVTTLDPGTYTVIVGGRDSTEGLAVLEMTELNSSSEIRIEELATRAYVGNGDDVLISGFMIAGPSARKVVIRALGPSLTEQGVPGALANPELAIFSGASFIKTNDDWESPDNSDKENIPLSLRPTNSLEAAVYMELEPGPYTAIVVGVDGGTGVGIVEVIEVLD